MNPLPHGRRSRAPSFFSVVPFPPSATFPNMFRAGTRTGSAPPAPAVSRHLSPYGIGERHPRCIPMPHTTFPSLSRTPLFVPHPEYRRSLRTGRRISLPTLPGMFFHRTSSVFPRRRRSRTPFPVPHGPCAGFRTRAPRIFRVPYSVPRSAAGTSLQTPYICSSFRTGTSGEGSALHSV